MFERTKIDEMRHGLRLECSPREGINSPPYKSKLADKEDREIDTNFLVLPEQKL